jgi:pimeloyl-ACP methyl ester carboxylesterase
MDRLSADDAELEYEVRGEGEPVLLIPLSGVVDGLAYPLFGQPALASKYKLIHYHRRGTAGSTRGEAADAAALLRHLNIARAHIAGHSFGALIALQLAKDEPTLVHSLVLLEPPLRGVPSAQAAGAQLFPPIIEAYREGDKRKAVELFCGGVFGPGWKDVVEQAVPGGSERALKDMDPFMQELAAYQSWHYQPTDAAASRIAVLSVLGVRSSQFVKEGRSLIHQWFPQAEDCDVQSTHLLQMQDPTGVAQGMADFFGRHPIH